MLFALSAFIGAAATGALLGLVGSYLGAETRAALATIAALSAFGVGYLELARRPIHLLQCDRETPQNWLQLGALRWATTNGVALGVGARSRIGFWLWYVVPVASVLMGNPKLGGVLYGTYGLARGMASLMIIAVARRREGWDYTVWLSMKLPSAKRVAATYMMLLGGTGVLIVGV